MWNCSQFCILPQRALRLRLRNVYKVSVISIRMKPMIPMLCPNNSRAAGTPPELITTNVYSNVIATMAMKDNQSSRLDCCIRFLSVARIDLVPKICDDVIDRVARVQHL